MCGYSKFLTMLVDKIWRGMLLFFNLSVLGSCYAISTSNDFSVLKNTDAATFAMAAIGLEDSSGTCSGIVVEIKHGLKSIRAVLTANHCVDQL